MREKLLEEIEGLEKKRIWVTKKSRMEAEARLKRSDFETQILVIYYTFVVLAFSIATLVSLNETISLFTVIASVGLFGASIFISAAKYKERSLGYKNSYIELTRLEFKLKSLLRKEETTDEELLMRLEEVEQEYYQVLEKTENHDDIDYIRVLIKHDLKMRSEYYSKYICYKIAHVMLICALAILPVLLVLYYFFSR